MAIERLSVPEGLPLDANFTNESIVGTILRERSNLITLPAGEYDLTPEIWTRFDSNAYMYNLIVNEDGTGIYRMLPNGRSSSAEFSRGRIENSKPGGRTFNLPGDVPMALVAGPSRINKRLQLFEIVFYAPGPSPLG